LFPYTTLFRSTGFRTAGGGRFVRLRAAGYPFDSAQEVPRRGGRVAEGDGLLNRYTTQKLYRGFESRPLRFPAPSPLGFGAFSLRSRVSRGIWRAPARGWVADGRERSDSARSRRSKSLRAISAVWIGPAITPWPGSRNGRRVFGEVQELAPSRTLACHARDGGRPPERLRSSLCRSVAGRRWVRRATQQGRGVQRV